MWNCDTLTLLFLPRDLPYQKFYDLLLAVRIRRDPWIFHGRCRGLRSPFLSLRKHCGCGWLSNGVVWELQIPLFAGGVVTSLRICSRAQTLNLGCRQDN